MAWENTFTGFTEHLHRRHLRQDRRNASWRWPALLRLALHKERLRIAPELHSTLLQGFLGASLRFCSVAGRVPAASPAKPILRRALDLIHKGLDQARAALLGLRSPALPDGSLEQALADIRDAFSPGSRTRLSFVILGQSRPLTPVLHDQIYWIAREALLNALRHSAARRVEVEIEYWPRKLRVVVRDNGAGIDRQALRSGRTSHLGLTGMHERAATIGATVGVWSQRREGTEVEISLPMLGTKSL